MKKASKEMNMKKYILGCLLLLMAGVAKAGDLTINALYNFQGFTTATSVTESSVTVSAVDAQTKNCLTDWSLMSTTVSNMTILDGELHGGTTIWGLVSVPASTPVNVSQTRETALCASPNSKLVISVSSGTVSISHKGYARKGP